MARTTPRPEPTAQGTLLPLATTCPACGGPLSLDYYNERTVSTLGDILRLRLGIRRCHRHRCPRHRKPLRPEAEGRIALPHHEFGLDVVALVGALRYREHRRLPEIHQRLTARRLVVARRSVGNLLDRYDELCALAAMDPGRLHPLLLEEGRAILAIDGLQPDVGHEVLWVIRECLTGQILLAESLLSSSQADLAELIRRAVKGLPVPVVAALSDGQHAIRNAVALALPGVPHQLCQFHFLREAGTPIYEMDRHAKKELKKAVRDIRALEREVEGHEGPQAEAVLGYCQAVRSALTDDGRPPLEDKGLRLHGRLEEIAASIERVAEKGGRPRSCAGCTGRSTGGWSRPRRSGRRCARASTCSSGWRGC
jgi:hypothetical protein